MKKITLFILLILSISIVKTKAQEKNYFAKEKKGKYCFVDNKGKEKTKYKYSYAEDFSEGYGVFEEKLKFGYLDSKFKLVIPAEYDDAGAFNDGLAYVCKDGKYGYIDKKGKIVIDLQYDYISSFKDGFAIARIRNTDTLEYGKSRYKMAVINKNNEVIGNKWFSSVDNQHEDYFDAKIKKERYYLYTNGEVELIPEKQKDIKEVESDEEIEEEVEVSFAVIEDKPEYPGGQNALLKYIAENTKYPMSAKENGIKGTLYVKFVISKTGEVINVAVINPISPIINKEAIRVIKSMPKWKPGKQRGKFVNVQYVVPISFVLH